MGSNFSSRDFIKKLWHVVRMTGACPIFQVNVRLKYIALIGTYYVSNRIRRLLNRAEFTTALRAADESHRSTLSVQLLLQSPSSGRFLPVSIPAQSMTTSAPPLVISLM